LSYAFTGSVLTPRLELRLFRHNDFAALFGFESRPDVMRYLYWSDPSAEAVRERLGRRIASDRLENEGDTLMLAVVRRDTSALIGHVMLHWVSQEHRQGEIGFVFDPDHQRQGYATEACLPLLAIAFDELGLHRVLGRADARNTASIALQRRLGMRQEAHLVQNEFVKGEWTDEVDCAVLATEWAASHPRP
jgi:RimJ/RimL family protein N-acetyltransferase